MTDTTNWDNNVAALVVALGDQVRGSTAAEHMAQLGELLDSDPAYSRLWLVWATQRGELPVESDVVNFRRDVKLNGGAAALSSLGNRADFSIFGYATRVEIVADAVMVDVHDTCRTDKMSGIQRVVRETVSRWAREHDIQLVAWTKNRRALRRVTEIEYGRVVDKVAASSDGTDPVETEQIVVPHGGLLVVPELAAESERAERLLALGRFSTTRTAFIGYDVVPMTSGETATDAIAAHFPLYLDAVAYSSRVATDSASTGSEFEAWKRMLPASGRTGPEVKAVVLAGDVDESTDESLAAARRRLKLDDAPMVLVVGTHEPRKNHLVVLQAARILWQRGERFRLVFIGSSSWGSAAFDNLAQVLLDQGYPLVIVKAASDSLLAASYRLAAVSIFTSFHEGFGLPIVESLRAGTPVIASNIGSMQEIADMYRGVITIDPHSDSTLQSTLHSVLSDATILQTLRTELASNTYRSWDQYAADVWSFFTAPHDAAAPGHSAAPGASAQEVAA
ncbi:glycosyltransferase family 4 protein [Subtercola sp. PAMC28395]|uniref:glycosyltransferase family 4 protein n=1 Tax=Subtercola sp. PAMC28395 TaxID=2846775 RepID=UPI001C0CCF44|nr:glycosyltransferase family 1 protein [Subtercola sp. PAMC28395]QWT25025.1 glycosyltransferase family 4 protein [Subtercola sp. PAMC28395]